MAAQIGYWVGVDLLGKASVILFIGVFVVWFPTVLSLRKSQVDTSSPSLWRDLLTGAPPWMLPLLTATFVYAIVNFFLGILGAYSTDGAGSWRMGTSHAMVFYGGAWGIAAGAVGREEQGIE